MPSLPIKNKRSLGINLIGWGVCVSNVLLFVSYYYTLLTDQPSAPRQFITFLSVLSVFPQDFFLTYLNGEWMSHLVWIFMMLTCAMGILLLNKFARLVFIVMNIFHVVILTYLVTMRFGDIDFVDFGFKLYLTLVVCGSYVGFLAIPDVRQQFEMNLERIRFTTWLDRSRIKTIKPQDSRGLYKLSLAYSNLGRYADALGVLRKAVAAEPDNVEFNYLLGLTHEKLHQNPETITALRSVVRVKPDHPEAWYHLGQAYLREGSIPEGITALERAARHPRPPAGIYKELGRAYIAGGRYEDAVATLHKASLRSPQDPEIFFHLGRVTGERLERYKEAREFLLKTLRMSPHFLEAQMELGLVCIKLNRYKDAIRALKEVLRQEGENKQAHYHLGFAYARIEDFESARRHYRILKNLDPDAAENLRMMIK